MPSKSKGYSLNDVAAEFLTPTVPTPKATTVKPPKIMAAKTNGKKQRHKVTVKSSGKTQRQNTTVKNNGIRRQGNPSLTTLVNGLREESPTNATCLTAKVKRDRRLELYLTPQTFDGLKSAAKSQGISVNEAANQIFNLYLKSETKQ